jgi:hypothetical protein
MISAALAIASKTTWSHLARGPLSGGWDVPLQLEETYDDMVNAKFCSKNEWQ